MEKQIVKIFNNSENDLPNYSTEFAAGFDIRADLSKIELGDDLIGNKQFTLTINDNGKIVTLLPGGRVLISSNLIAMIRNSLAASISSFCQSSRYFKYSLVISAIGIS